MRMFLLLLLSVIVLASAAPALRNAYAQQPAQSYTPPTYAPQTFAPQTFAPQTHAPQSWSPQTGDSRGRPTPRRRLVKCMVSAELDDYCSFYSDRDLRRGSACSCDGNRGSIH